MPNQDQLLIELRKMAEFAGSVGDQKLGTQFQHLLERLQAEPSPSKRLQEEIFDARGLASFRIPRHISKQPCSEARKKELEQTFFGLRTALDDALIPPKPAAFPEADVQGLAGNAEYTKVLGNPRQAHQIAKRAMEVVTRFSTAVFGRDLETAYGLCANELRTRMSLKRFCTELEKADQRYSGRPVQCKIEQVAWIWADEISRQKTGSKPGDWPKDTPKLNKRATVGTFWFTDPVNNLGRWAFFWVTEEAEGYRVAKFQQYVQ